jgi:hypothetical protein
VKPTRVIALIAALLVAALLVAPFFMASELTVSRRVAIAALPRDAWNLVADLERHPAWHPWDLSDPNPRLVFGETRYGASASYFWIGARDNHGMLKFERVDERAREIDGILDLSSVGAAHLSFRFDPRDGGVVVTETFRQSSGRNVFRRYLHPVYRAAAARQLEANLARLKQVAEGHPLAAPTR